MATSIVDNEAPLFSSTSRKLHQSDLRSEGQKRRAIWFILVTVSFERLAYYSLVGNLVLFLTSTSIQWTELHSVTASLIFYGTSYVSALIVSWISDSKLTRAKTIIAGFLLYIGGYLFIPLFARTKIYEKLCNGPPITLDESASYFQERCSVQITATLVVIAIGVGAVQANMAILGAEQSGEGQSISRYFDKYYIAVNVGCIFAYGLIGYLQLNQSYFIGYLIPVILLLMTLVVFLVGYKCKYFIHVKPFRSVMGYFFPVLINAFHTWFKRRCCRLTHHSQCKSGYQKIPSFSEDESFEDSQSVTPRNISSILDYAKASNHGKFYDGPVNDIKALRPIVVMFLILIPYWLLYLQTETTFIVQGVHMRIPKLQPNTSPIPLSWLSLIDRVITIVVLIVLNTCVYKHLKANSKLFSINNRFIIGMAAAAMSMIITGIVEIFRQIQCHASFSQSIGIVRRIILYEALNIPVKSILGNTSYSAADMSIFYQLPQHISMGIGEVFVSVASLEFAYVAAPESARSFVMSFRFCTAGLSSFLGSAYVSVYENINENFTTTNFECKDAQKSELFYIYFFVLAGFQFIFILIFMFCERKCKMLRTYSKR